jgi:hypothetical protein
MIMKLIRLINKILLRKMRKTRIWSALKAIKMSIFYRINRRYKVPDMSGIRRGDSLVKIRGLGKTLMEKAMGLNILSLLNMKLFLCNKILFQRTINKKLVMAQKTLAKMRRFVVIQLL